MNWNSFNALGYLSVILWIAVPVLWVLHARMKPRRWLVHVSLLVALLALVFAKINSKTHVNRIQQDMSEQLAAVRAEQEAKRQAELDARGDEVAQIRFAEDDQDDFLDRAGLDESELKYRDKLEEPEVPEWMKDKKERGTGTAEEDTLEGAIGGVEESEGMESESLDKSEARAPVVMKADELEMANRLDALNLNTIRVLILIALVLILLDYLKRANVYSEAYLPLPLPSGWINAATPLAVEFERPEPARRPLDEELRWLVKRGDSFVLFSDRPGAVELPEHLPRFVRGGLPVEVLEVSDSDELVNDDFVFETAWYGRGCFMVGSRERSVSMLERFVELLKQRRVTRARLGQTVHLVWTSKSPIPEPLHAELLRLGGAAGFSIFHASH